eukprot:GHUV01054331.1.p2 GENE.GHUV01054331.1~~GHUV01054331.1.p2  ORF type:complete len:159 (-),score=26.51 GHUV01054331.1:169-645(-)
MALHAMHVLSSGLDSSMPLDSVTKYGHPVAFNHTTYQPTSSLVLHAVTVVAPEPAKTVVAAQPVKVEDTAVPAAPAEAADSVPAVAEPEPPKFTTVKQLRLRSAAAYLPHVNKESYGGEDAHFISNISGGAIGVADGELEWCAVSLSWWSQSRLMISV